MKRSKKLSKIIKVTTLVLILFLSLLFGASLYLHNWLEENLVSSINESEDRAYDISYESFDLSSFFKGFKLRNVSILPLNKKEGTIITCKIEKVVIGGFNWRDFIFKRHVNFTQMAFVKPDFEVTIGAEGIKEEAPSKQLQNFFGDILSRAKLNNFKLVKGSFVLYKSAKKLSELAHVGEFNFEAKDIETDSVQWKYPIPFKLREFSSSIKDILFNVDDFTTLRCASIEYNPKKSNLELKNVSLKLNKHWTYVNDRIGKQVDIMEFDLKSLRVKDIGANSQLYGSYDIRSKTIEIDGLNLKDYKNKNKPFINNKKQAMFSGMVAQIPIGLKVDEVIIKNTNISYTEIPNGKNNPGTIYLDKLKGRILNLTTLDSLQKEYKAFEISLMGKLNKTGKLSLDLRVPYAEDKFNLEVKLEDYAMTKLNSTIEPMLGVIVNSGHLNLLHFKMKANSLRSENKLVMQYTDLELNVLDENKDFRKKRGLITGVANSMVKDHNLPGEKKYTEAKYNTVRDPYRAPFNYIWLSIQDGIPEVVLTDLAKELIKSNERRNKKRERKKKD